MVNNKRAAQSGFTLIETVIALFVFSLLILIFATSIPVARKATNMNGQYAQAISLCQHKIDQLRAVGYGRLNYAELHDAGMIDDAPSSSPFSFKVVDEASSYLFSPTATVQIDDVYSNVRRLTVTVSWKNATYESKTSSAHLTALIANTE